MASRARDAKASRRMLAIALVLDGADRTTAAQSCGMDRQTLRDWVHRYNAEGAEGAEGTEGLSDRRRSGRPGMLSADQKTETCREGARRPGPGNRWRDPLAPHRPCDEDQGSLRCGHARTHGRQASHRAWLPAALGAPPTSQMRPASPGDAQKSFRKAVKAALPKAAHGKPLEVWFQDEAKVGQQGTLTRIRAERGTGPRASRDTRYEWAYIFGAVCPTRAETAALVMPRAKAHAMDLHLSRDS